MKSSVSTNICYAFLALSITVLPAACALPDSGPADTPAKPAEEKPKPAVSPPVPKTWRWSRLTNSENRSIRGLHVNPHTSLLSVTTYTSNEESPVMGILIRRFRIPSNREIFPLRFFTAWRGGNRLDPSAALCGEEICYQFKYSYMNDVVFDNQGKVYLLDSTGDLSASPRPVRIVAFTNNFRDRGAHPREMLAGGGRTGFGHADGTGADAWFNEGVRNMVMSTDKKYIYAADWLNNRVRAVEIESKKVTTLKPIDAEGNAVRLPRPTGMAVGKGNTVYTIRNSGGVGTIAALTVPLPLHDDNAVRARVLKLIDEKGKDYYLRDTPVWYIAVDDNGVLYSHIQRAGARYIVRIRLKDAEAEDLVGVVSEVAVAKGVGTDSSSIRGLEVSGDGKTIYYANGGDVYAYTYE